jgi:hypothetical protein
MKTGVVLALAASAAATGFRNFPPFNCPENTNNKCTDRQKPGFSFGDLNLGPFTGYNDFSWKGFTCGNKGGGGRFNNGGNGKTIGGVCTSDKKNSPSFGCGPKIDKFSLGSIFVKPEFDCDLEFIYDMPDGKTCKHRSFCKKGGSNVINKQCGGAKNVTIIFPPQPNKPKPVCSIDIETISFDCNPPKTTFTPPAPPATVPPTTTTSNSPVQSTPPNNPPVVSSPPVVPPAVSSPPVVPPAVSSPPVVPPVVSSPPIVPPVVSSVPPVVPPVVSIPPVVPSVETSTVVVSSTVTIPTTAVVTTTAVTTFETTSTVFSTVTSTITSCAPTVPDCNGGVKTTVVTVAVSTTICPATETITAVLTTSTDVTTVVTTTSVPVVVPPPVGSLTSNSPIVPTGPAKPPVDTLPCPDVVPKCLNTFLFDVKCKDNSDHTCYCPDAIFVKNVMECLFAHGESDTIISEAVIFFQGICAPFVPTNPGIVTGVPTYVTVTAPPTAIVPIFTTVTVDATTVLPCTDDAGEVIPSSSTTSTIFTTLTLPQVGFTTQSGSVGVIPVTLPPFPVETPKGPIGAPGGPGFFTTAAPTGPIGTGGVRPVPTGAVVTAGSGRVTAGLGFSVAIAVLAAMGL